MILLISIVSNIKIDFYTTLMPDKNFCLVSWCEAKVQRFSCL